MKKNKLKQDTIKDDEKAKKSSNMKKFPTVQPENSDKNKSEKLNNNPNNMYPSDIQLLFERLGIV